MKAKTCMIRREIALHKMLINQVNNKVEWLVNYPLMHVGISVILPIKHKENRRMKELAILVLVALSSVFILGYSIHMLIGGLVSEGTEKGIIVIACTVGVAIISFMGWDIMRQRRRR
jgi:hypothetical protein